MLLIDSHCHLDRLNYKTIHTNINDVLQKAYKNYVKIFLTISTSIDNFEYVSQLYKSHKNIFYSYGIHPLYLKNNNILNLNTVLNNKKIIAIGETGLDYHSNDKKKNEQQKLFEKHINLSIKTNKPIIIHSRNAILDTIKILKNQHNYSCRGVLHSFCEDINYAKQLLDIGFYISFSGIITFKNADNIRTALKYIPIDCMLIETDSPYLTPIPYRGKENQPAFLYNIAKYISDYKKISLQTISEVTTKNFINLFGIQLDDFMK
ncbi:MAG: TatD family hydrolase [Buchnera aphidicola (Eriosoma harunire)]